MKRMDKAELKSRKTLESSLEQGKSNFLDVFDPKRTIHHSLKLIRVKESVSTP
jgi:hypothetical protein